MAGYSSTSLQKKLGIKAGFVIAVFNAPEKYWDWIAPLPEAVQIIQHPKRESVDFSHLFVSDEKSFQKEFLNQRRFLKKNGMLWVSWPKKSSKIVTDLNENLIRDFGLENGLVDVKVCAIDETWSGLKFVYRLSDR